MSAPVVLVGAAGRMGRFAARLLSSSEAFPIVATVERGDDLDAALEASEARLGLDLTVAGLGFEHARRMLAAGVRPVVGTSGVSADEVRALDADARRLGLGGRVVPNFSRGAWLLQRLACQAAALFPACELVEGHHERKKDAPSGTARALAAALAAARGPGPGDAPVPVHSLRLPGLYAHHAVHLGAPGETLTLRHDMTDPAAFGPGILFALELAATDAGVHVGLPWETRL